MATEKCEGMCNSITIKMTVKNIVEPEPNPPVFTIVTQPGKSLLQAMMDFGHSSTDFGFETRVRHACPFLVQVTVNGKTVENGEKKFWDVVLNSNGDIRPLCLHCYTVKNNDNIFLRFAHF